MKQKTSFTLDDKTLWALELAMRVSNRTMSSLATTGLLREVEAVLTPEAVQIRAPRVPHRFERYWSPDEGVRHLLMLYSDLYMLDAAEHEETTLIDEHREVWFDDDNEPIGENVNVLHDHLKELVQLRRKTSSRVAVRRRIVEILKKAAADGKV